MKRLILQIATLVLFILLGSSVAITAEQKLDSSGMPSTTQDMYSDVNEDKTMATMPHIAWQGTLPLQAFIDEDLCTRQNFFIVAHGPVLPSRQMYIELI
jgi:hypothetical protein